MTNREVLGPLMQIGNRAAADKKLAELAETSRQENGGTLDDAIERVRATILWYAGYFDAKTLDRVKRMFGREVSRT
jgi:hypothetical protein